jgi:hypothetical protein
MAIEVKLAGNDGVKFITQHYGIENWKQVPMIIPYCSRCIGILIFWKPKKAEDAVHSITGAHIAPHAGKSIKKVRKGFFRKLLDQMEFSEPYLVIIAGGRIDTPTNIMHYKRSLRYFGFPFEEKFPGLQVSVYKPQKNITSTTLIVDEKGEIRLRYYTDLAS